MRSQVDPESATGGFWGEITLRAEKRHFCIFAGMLPEVWSGKGCSHCGLI